MHIEDLFSPDRIYITIAIIATIGLFLVSVLIGVTTRRRQHQLMTACRYRPKKRIMDGPERRCFQLLNELFGQKFYILSDVELSSLLNHKVGTQDRHTAYDFIKGHRVDFVLCNKRTMRPICAIKMYDPHAGKTPGDRPEDMRKFFKSAHLPFVYLEKRHDISRDSIIDEFSKTVYETSQA